MTSCVLTASFCFGLENRYDLKRVQRVISPNDKKLVASEDSVIGALKVVAVSISVVATAAVIALVAIVTAAKQIMPNPKE